MESSGSQKMTHKNKINIDEALMKKRLLFSRIVKYQFSGFLHNFHTTSDSSKTNQNNLSHQLNFKEPSSKQLKIKKTPLNKKNELLQLHQIFSTKNKKSEPKIQSDIKPQPFVQKSKNHFREQFTITSDFHRTKNPKIKEPKTGIDISSKSTPLWEDTTNDSKISRKNFLKQSGLNVIPAKRKRDPLDIEYDKGKVKKVPKRKDLFNQPNLIQKIYEKKKKYQHQ